MRTLWKPVMGLLCTVSMTSMAQAQDAQDSDAPEREVIIVTATLRAADVQEIPIAVTAVTTLALGTLVAAPEVIARHMPMSWEKINDVWYNYVKGHNPYEFFGLYDCWRLDTFWLDK